MEDGAFFRKYHVLTRVNPTIPLSFSLSKFKTYVLTKTFYLNVHNRIIHNSQMVEIQMLANGWLENKMWYIHTMELRESTDICCKMDESWKRCATKTICYKIAYIGKSPDTVESVNTEGRLA